MELTPTLLSDGGEMRTSKLSFRQGDRHKLCQHTPEDASRRPSWDSRQQQQQPSPVRTRQEMQLTQVRRSKAAGRSRYAVRSCFKVAKLPRVRLHGSCGGRECVRRECSACRQIHSSTCAHEQNLCTNKEQLPIAVRS